MPELPEVEWVARGLRPIVTGRTITEVECIWPGHIDRPDVAELCARLTGRTITGVQRRGKYLVLTLDSGEFLLIHLRMSGNLMLSNPADPRDKHVHTVFHLAASPAGEPPIELRFQDQRKFGRVYLVHDPQEVLYKLGPEPLDDDFTVEVLRQRLHGRKRLLKPLLLDQTIVAGVGNIYADEALWDARLHPLRRTDTLTDDEITRLHAAIRRALQRGIEHGGSSISIYIRPDGSQGAMQNEFNVYNQTGRPCPRCSTPIEKMFVAGRGTHICPVCQKREDK